MRVLLVVVLILNGLCLLSFHRKMRDMEKIVLYLYYKSQYAVYDGFKVLE